MVPTPPTDLEKKFKRQREPGKKKTPPRKEKGQFFEAVLKYPEPAVLWKGSILGEFICVLIKEPLLS
jgi:hypothetical protein